jgi:hypothetical protein
MLMPQPGAFLSDVLLAHANNVQANWSAQIELHRSKACSGVLKSLGFPERPVSDDLSHNGDTRTRKPLSGVCRVISV